MTDVIRPRAPRLRPALARWLWDRGYNWNEAGELFACSGEAVRLWCLPFGDPKRRTPDQPSMEKISTRTEGAVQAGDFYPPHLNGETTPPPLEAVQ